MVLFFVSGRIRHTRSYGDWSSDVCSSDLVRQLALFNVDHGQVEGFFPEFRPFVALCAFPDCTHTHEEKCAIKRAVYRRQVSASRYTSYLGMISGEGIS